MENITLGQIVTAIGVITVLAGFFYKIYKWYKIGITDKLDNFERRITALEAESKSNKEENELLLKGLLACLKGLQEQGCDGPVTKSISEIENYLLDVTHR